MGSVSAVPQETLRVACL